MNTRTLETCPGCGLVGWEPEEESFRGAERFGASPSCWHAFGEVLRREYESSTLYFAVHPLTLDAYAAQHPQGMSEPSLALHLVQLHSVFELGHDVAMASGRARRFTRHARDYGHLDPPPRPAELTVAHVLDATSELDHIRRVWEWAEAVWQSWSAHHAQIARWAGRAG